MNPNNNQHPPKLKHFYRIMDDTSLVQFGLKVFREMDPDVGFDADYSKIAGESLTPIPTSSILGHL